MAIKFGHDSAATAKPKKAKPKSVTAQIQDISSKTLKEATTAKIKPSTKLGDKAKADLKRPSKALAVIQNGAINDIAKLHTYEEFKLAGHAILRRTVEAVFWLGELLWRGKKILSKEQFADLSVDLSMAATTISQYMTIAKSDRLKELREKNGDDMPTGAHVLYLIASMDDDEFKAFNKQHDVSRELETSDLREFRAAWKDKKGIARLPKTTRQAAEQAVGETANQATAPVGDEGGFQEGSEAPQDGDGPKGSPAITQPLTGALATARELGEGLLSISSADIVAGIADLFMADEMLTFMTTLTEHVNQIRTTVADKQWDLQEAA